jgi:hypothetical protein
MSHFRKGDYYFHFTTSSSVNNMAAAEMAMVRAIAEAADLEDWQEQERLFHASQRQQVNVLVSPSVLATYQSVAYQAYRQHFEWQNTFWGPAFGVCPSLPTSPPNQRPPPPSWEESLSLTLSTLHKEDRTRPIVPFTSKPPMMDSPSHTMNSPMDSPSRTMNSPMDSPSRTMNSPMDSPSRTMNSPMDSPSHKRVCRRTQYLGEFVASPPHSPVGSHLRTGGFRHLWLDPRDGFFQQLIVPMNKDWGQHTPFDIHRGDASSPRPPRCLFGTSK